MGKRMYGEIPRRVTKQQVKPIRGKLKDAARAGYETGKFLSRYDKRFSRKRLAGPKGPLPNPMEDAARLYEEFHGKPSAEVVEVEETLHVHDVLAELGELLRLDVIALDGARVKLSGFEGALLCSNEDGSQLFIRGGDQFIDLDVFEIAEPHESEVLGTVKRIWYGTEKLHLGKDGGRAKYFHDFGEEGGRRPHLVYHHKDPSLELAGGSYVVKPEGVRN